MLLHRDPGYALVRYRGSDYTTTVAAGLGIPLAALLSLVLAWNPLRLPFRAREGKSRNARPGAKLPPKVWPPPARRLRARAEQLLKQAADNGDAGAVAPRMPHAQAGRGDDAAAAALRITPGERHPAQAVLLASRRWRAAMPAPHWLRSMRPMRSHCRHGLRLRADALAVGPPATGPTVCSRRAAPATGIPATQLDALPGRPGRSPQKRRRRERWRIAGIRCLKRCAPRPMVAAYARRGGAAGTGGDAQPGNRALDA